MDKRRLGKSGISIAPLAFGGNVFGWTVDEATSFRLLDAFVDKGFNLIDTADVYSRWHPGNEGGESEKIIGRWLKKSGKRNSVIIATKVGMEMAPGKKGLSKKYILQAVEDSLRRLQVDHIDLYQAHKDDPSVPIEETLHIFSELIGAGKVRIVGASQIDGERMRQSMEVGVRLGLGRYCTLQPLYNLYDREVFEKELLPVINGYGLGVLTYYSLASGFLSGKYRSAADLAKSVRGERSVKERYLNDRGSKILQAMDTVSQRVNAPLSSLAIAWLLSRPGVTAPIASATTLEQLDQLVAGVNLKLDEESLKLLDEAAKL